MPLSLRRTISVAAAVALGPCAAAAQNSGLPQATMSDASGGEIVEAERAVAHFTEICHTPEGNFSAAITALKSLGYAEMGGAIKGKFPNPAYRITADFDVEGETYSSCTLNVMTTAPAGEIEAPLMALSPVGSGGPMTGLTSIAVRGDDGKFASTFDPALMGGNALKIVTMNWFARQ